MQRCKAAPNNIVVFQTKTVKDIKLLRPKFAEESFVSIKNKFFTQKGPALKYHLVNSQHLQTEFLISPDDCRVGRCLAPGGPFVDV